jgi:signal transduction histidine kinase
MQTDTDLSTMPKVATKRPHQERSWTWWLMPRPFYLVSTAIYLGVFIPFLFNFASGSKYDGELWRLLLMIFSIALLFALDRLEYWRYGEETPTRAAIVLLVTRILLYEVVAWVDLSEFSPFLAVYLPILGFLYFGSVVAYGLALLACVDYAIHHLVNTSGWLTNPTEIHYDILFILALVFALTMAQVLIREKAIRTRSEHLLAQLREAHRELEEAHQQLRAYAEQVEELATTKERNRLARDIHDSLGHYLTIINVQLEKALTFRELTPQEADQAVRDAKRLASEALQDVRRSVSTLREMQETFAFTPAVTDLVERLHNSQLSIELSIEGSEDGYSKQALMTLYRAVQEGLTNIQKHAGATSVQVETQFGDAFATLCLRDNGRGFEPETLATLRPGREGSYGLQGVRERLEMVGGSLQMESRPGEGTCLLVTIQKEPLMRNGLLHVQVPKE